MKHWLLTAITASFFLGSGNLYYVCAQSTTEDSPERAVQSLGSRTRAEITRVGRYRGCRARTALSIRRRSSLAARRADESRRRYGRAEETVSVLQRERSSAMEARPRALKEIERARGAGVATARAENDLEQGTLWR